MPDNDSANPTPDGAIAQSGSADANTGKTPIDSLPADIQEYIRQLRKEAESAKDKAKAEKERLQQEASNAEKTRLAEQQEWQKLAERLQAEQEALKPKLSEAETYRAAVDSTVKARIAALPAQFRNLVPDFDNPLKTMQWLDANASILQTPAAPQLDAGAQGDASKALPRLTPEEQQLASMAGMTAQQFAEYRARSQAQVKPDKQ